MLRPSFGCIRIYNQAMKELGELYSELVNKKKKIYCYIEDYDGDIKDVYDHYSLDTDSKDKKRAERSASQ